jgi:hypothetical protein
MTTTNPMCIGGMYPIDGIPGVFGITVTNTQKIDLYRETVGVGVDDEVIFTEMTNIPADMKEWFLPGDVICSNGSIAEPYLDILRSKVTIHHQSNLCRVPKTDHDFIEEVRQRSVEEHAWSLDRENYGHRYDEVVISDPFGRAVHLLLVHQTSGKLIPAMDSVFPRTPRWRMRLKSVPPQRIRVAWIAIKKLHSMMLAHDGDIPGDDYIKYREIIRHLYGYHIKSPWAPDETLLLRMVMPNTNLFRKWPFWKRIKEIHDENPRSLPRPLAIKAARPRLRWIRVCPREVEESYDFVNLPEWDLYRPPFHIEEIKDNEFSGNWR